MTSAELVRGPVDLVVVGAGIGGLAHAAAAVARGARVAVVERDERATGASVQNFGHGCFTAQAGTALNYALAARSVWLTMAKQADFWLRDAGTVVVARAEDELAVLRDFAADRDGDVVLLSAKAVRDRLPIDGQLLGGAWLPLDIRVDPRTALPAIARRLAEQGVHFSWHTSVLAVNDGEVRTSRGPIRAAKVVVAIGHDVDRLYPEVAEAADLQRCVLSMLQVASPDGRDLAPAALTGWSLLRYDGFRISPALGDVRARLAAAHPAEMGAVLNLMFTQRPDGDLVVGDTHSYHQSVPPFAEESADEIVLARAGELFGVSRFRIRQRWRGVYASAPQPFLIAAPHPDHRVVSVTSGIGMTTAFGLAHDVVDELL